VVRYSARAPGCWPGKSLVNVEKVLPSERNLLKFRNVALRSKSARVGRDVFHNCRSG
jgi:hypothetical protein